MNGIKKKYEPLRIDQVKLFIGIGLALFFAFIFYAFQYFLREIMRLIATSERYEVWLLSDQEVFFYNWFFAGLALIIGQSIALSFIFERPKKPGRRVNKRNSILNDQRVLQYSFLMWMLKLAFFYGVFFGIPAGGYLSFSFFPDFSIILVLVLIVLFFQSWNTIRLAFKAASFKWMSVSFGSILIISLIMANINFIDYKKMNEHLLKNNMEYSYELELPEINYTNYYAGENRFEYDIVRDTVDTNTLLIKIDDRIRPVFDENGDFLIQNTWCQVNQRIEPVYLRMDKRISYESVRKIVQGFYQANQTLVYFAVLENGTPKKYSSINYHGVSCQRQFPVVDSTEYLQNMESLKQYSNQINISLFEPGVCEVDGDKVSYLELEDRLYRMMLEDPNYILFYHIEDQIQLQDYLTVRATFFRAGEHLIDNYSWDVYGQSFYGLEGTGLGRDLRKKFPIRIIELPVLFVKG